MRQYRGLTKEGKWVYGWYLEMPGKQKPQVEDQGNGMVSCQLVDAEIVSCIAYKSKTHVALDFCKVIRETVGQSTGLYDRNGKEDYFDDILQTYYDDGKTEGDIGVLVWNNDAGTIDLKSKRGQFPLYVYAYHEVIGDIHTMPELLEQDNE